MLALNRFLMNAIHSFWLAAVSAPVTMAKSPVPRSAAPLRRSARRDPFGRRLVHEEVARVRLGVGIPRQHVDAALPRLPQHRRNAGAILDGDTAMTSTLRVIQLSTSSFCFAGSRLVGPSQMRSTPSSCAASSAPARQLTKYGSPFAFGIMAMVSRRAAVGARLSAARPDGWTERTSHTFVERDDRRTGENRGAEYGDLTVSHRNPFGKL